MSQENVELARRYVEAFNAGGLDATQGLRHPSIEVVDPPNVPDVGVHIGETAARTRVESYLAFGWDGQFHAPEYLEAGDEVVVIWRMLGAIEGVPLDLVVCHVYSFEGSKVRRIRQYLSREEALEAVGLSE
jgi:ketosteroid isomerase-like protein